MSLIDLSRIHVNRGIKSRLGWTKYIDLYEIVHPSLDLIFLRLLTGAEALKVYTERKQLKTKFEAFSGRLFIEINGR